MSVRSEGDTTSAVERWRSTLTGPQLEAQHDLMQTGTYEQPASRDDGPGPGASRRDQYDEDYDYYWGDWRVPLWIALIMQVPWRQRLDIFVIGFIVGLVIAGVALSWGILLSRY